MHKTLATLLLGTSLLSASCSKKDATAPAGEPAVATSTAGAGSAAVAVAELEEARQKVATLDTKLASGTNMATTTPASARAPGDPTTAEAYHD